MQENKVIEANLKRHRINDRYAVIVIPYENGKCSFYLSDNKDEKHQLEQFFSVNIHSYSNSIEEWIIFCEEQKIIENAIIAHETLTHPSFLEEENNLDPDYEGLDDCMDTIDMIYEAFHKIEKNEETAKTYNGCILNRTEV